jgi:hypothetical protein
LSSCGRAWVGRCGSYTWVERMFPHSRVASPVARPPCYWFSSGYTIVCGFNHSLPTASAVKLVDGSFPFTPKTAALCPISHCIREFARRAGAKVCYINSKVKGWMEIGSTGVSLSNWLLRSIPRANSFVSFFFTSKHWPANPALPKLNNPLLTFSYASSLGYYTLLRP